MSYPRFSRSTLVFTAPLLVALLLVLAISLIVMSVNFIGDSFRDRLDPALRGKG
jgi:ABC-type dipeptide/oligopeptide/nickel transport system permease subunit